MRILISTGAGLGVGLLFLVQILGWFSWFPSAAFTAIHTPAILVAKALGQGEAGWSVIPFTLVAQWILIGAAVGLVLHLKHGHKPVA